MANEDLSAKQTVIDRVVALFVSTDRRNWSAVGQCFADPVLFDMTSMAGGEPAHLHPGEIIAGWRDGLAPMEAVHHQVGNFEVRLGVNEADVFCYGIAYHYRRVVSGRNTRVFVGSYDLHLVSSGAGRWLIDRFRFDLKFIDGNQNLHSENAAL